MLILLCIFFFKQKTAYEMRISDWSSDVCSSDLAVGVEQLAVRQAARVRNVARREAGARIALFAGEACRRARIDHLLGAAADVREHLFLGAHRLCVAPHGEVAVAQRLLAISSARPSAFHLASPPSSSATRSDEHTSELPSIMHTSYAVFC